MNVTLTYRGRSDVADSAGRQIFRLVPNLTRDPVGFDAPLLKPLRFREAMSALHDVVISDLRFKPREKSAYEQWKKDQTKRVAVLRKEARKNALAEIAQRRGVSVGEFEDTFQQLRKKYWTARQKYSNYLYNHDMDLWRRLMPCDPVITVADDVAFFECFSADESSYGCLTVDREDGFGKADGVKFGTTNVDYSWDLYNHFQSLRSYRETRFSVDPEGFTVNTQDAGAGIREEKIDLPTSWLRGFMTLQSAMTMPSQVVSLSREAVYSILAFLKRHKAQKSPRALRFEMTPGKAVELVLEPWGQRIETHGAKYEGPAIEPIRVWGTRRLLVLARTLPLAERFDVHLLGTGLPHFWVARMGEMKLTLGLSGWTTNDWTRGSAVDLLAPPQAPSPDLVNNVAAVLRERRSGTAMEIAGAAGADIGVVTAALRQLAHSGQAIHDLPGNVYRWRQIMPKALGEAEIGPEHPEMLGARGIMASGRADLVSRDEAPKGGYVLTGKVESYSVEIMVDGDGRIRRGKCGCSYFHRFALKNGPCRHMLALRWRSSVKALEAMKASAWYRS